MFQRRFVGGDELQAAKFGKESFLVAFIQAQQIRIAQYLVETRAALEIAELLEYGLAEPGRLDPDLDERFALARELVHCKRSAHDRDDQRQSNQREAED